MTRRDAAVLLFVAAGIYCLVSSLGLLSTLIELFAPPVDFPTGFSTGVYFASFLIPFALLLAAGQLLIRGRRALAARLFDDKEALPASNGQPARVQALGAFALAALGLLCLFNAVGPLTAVIQLAQPFAWHSASATRMIMLSVLHPALLVAYLLLGWWLFSRREGLATRWLISEEAPSRQSDSQSNLWEPAAFRVVGLYFMMVALVPLSHALVRLVAAGPAVTATPWEFWPELASGGLQLLFGVSVFAGKKGFAAALRKVGSLRRV